GAWWKNKVFVVSCQWSVVRGHWVVLELSRSGRTVGPPLESGPTVQPLRCIIYCDQRTTDNRRLTTDHKHLILPTVNILLVPIGSHGDVHPFIGIGLALRARGHRVRVIVNP